MKIAISGKMRAGKDYVASIIIKNYPGFKRMAFADELKIMCDKTFGVDKTHKNGREILQLFGRIGRLVDENFWVEKVIQNFNDMIPFSKIEIHPVITDLRFKNEAKYLKEQGYYLIRIESDKETRESRGKLSNQDDESEIDLDDYEFDYYIYNNRNTSEEEILVQFRDFLLND